MQVIFWIARKYLFSRRLSSSVNLMAGVSITGMLAGTIALVLALSVFNGFYVLIRELYQAFDADIKIIPTSGKYMKDDPEIIRKLRKLPGVAAVSSTLEGRAILKYHEKQAIIRLKGVKADFTEVSRIQELIRVGNYELGHHMEIPLVVLGSGVAWMTNANIQDRFNPMTLFTLDERANLLNLSPEKAMRSIGVYPAGYFALQKEYDDNFVLIDYRQAAKVLDKAGKISSYELRTDGTVAVTALKTAIENMLGNQFEVATWYEQHQTMYRIMQNEKAVGFWVLVLMLILAATNIGGCITMIVLEKRKDIGILQTQGMTSGQITGIFLVVGGLIGLVAATGGMVVGALLGWVQQTYGILKMDGGSSFIIEHFPLEMQWTDFFITGITVLIISLLSAWYPAYLAGKNTIIFNLRS
jgi:lipoprotein-releasing system permease protein